MKKEIRSKNSPEAIGPYSQAIETNFNRLIFISGQLAIDPNSKRLIEGTIDEKTHQVMKNLKSILNEAGLSFENVIKSTIYCTNLDNFKNINEVYGSYFNKPYPARATIQVSALPLGALVEIEMIAEAK